MPEMGDGLVRKDEFVRKERVGVSGAGYVPGSSGPHVRTGRVVAEREEVIDEHQEGGSG
jgi:hypothetical protein